MRDITYLEGDATRPLIRRGRNAVIAHVVNSCGGWGSGLGMFTGALSRRWPEPEHEYREWYARQRDWEMGAVLFVKVEPRIVVANMLCQHGYRRQDNPVPLKYPALAIAWDEVVHYAAEQRADVHFPKLGTVRAGGDWSIISEILQRDVPDGVNLFCYNLKP